MLSQPLVIPTYQKGYQTILDFDLSRKQTFMQERPGIVTMKGNPITLIGPELKVGDEGPTFVAIDNDLFPVSLNSFKE